MNISFVILSWNSEKYIAGCLDSIAMSLADCDLNYEILIVDNGSKDQSPAILRAYEKRYQGTVVPIFLEENVGTTVSRNIALKKTQGEYLCIMDSDVEAQAGVFKKLIKMLEENPQVGMVVPRILYPSGRWQKSIDRFPTVTHKINRLFRLRHIEAREASLYGKETEAYDVDYAISAMWFFRRELLEKVGFLDEKIFYSPEDVDYCIRTWKAGFRIVYVPRVRVVHHTQELSRGWKINKIKFIHLKGLIYLFAKHGYFLSRSCLRSG